MYLFQIMKNRLIKIFDSSLANILPLRNLLLEKICYFFTKSIVETLNYLERLIAQPNLWRLKLLALEHEDLCFQ